MQRKLLRVNNVLLCIGCARTLSKTVTENNSSTWFLDIYSDNALYSSGPCYADWTVDAVKDYETDTEIIKISALPAVRPSCGDSVVLAANIITGWPLLCSVTGQNFSSVPCQCGVSDILK